MSSGEDKPSADGTPSAAGSPYDEPTEAIEIEAVERPRVRRPKPDNDDFFDRHGRRPAPSVKEAIDEKTQRDTAADAEPEPTVQREPTVQPEPTADAPTEVLPVTPPGEPADEPPADAKTAVIINSGADAASQNPVRKSSSTEPVHTEPFVDDEEAGDEAGESGGGRRFAQQMTEAPLPYIEPQPTTPLEVPDAYPEFDEPDAAVVPAEPETPQAEPVARRGTLDLGLLLLRLVIGATFTVHGLQKLTGWMNGPGPGGFADFLANNANPSLGFNESVTTTLSFVAGVSETAGGILLILGLLTPIAGAAVLSSILVAATYKVTLAGGLWFFAGDGEGSGIELEIVLAAAAAALILTGPGTYSVDRRWGWARRPAWGSAVWLVVGIGVAVAVWMVFNGSNPLA